METRGTFQSKAQVSREFSKKLLILSFFVMIIIELLSALGNSSHASVYLLLDTGMNAPRFLALGLVIGYLFDLQKGKV